MSCLEQPRNLHARSAVIARSVASLGEPRFHQTLFDVLHLATEMDMLSVFSFGDNDPPRFHFAHAASDERLAFAADASRRYAAAFWKLDPAWQQPGLRHGAVEAPAMKRQSWQQIPESDYRVACYEQPQVVDRVSICGRVDGGRQVVVNVYRRAGQGLFDRADLASLAGQAELAVAMTSQHLHIGELKGRCGVQPDRAAVESRLAVAFPALSRRERAICAGVLAGLSMKEVANALALELSSAITYKRRAYAKLAVTDRRGLVAAYDRISVQ